MFVYKMVVVSVFSETQQVLFVTVKCIPYRARNFHGIKFSWIAKICNFHGINFRGLNINLHTTSTGANV